MPRPTCKSGPRTLQEWAKDKVAPREEEISQLRNLIRRIEADVSELDDHDRIIDGARLTAAIGGRRAGDSWTADR